MTPEHLTMFRNTVTAALETLAKSQSTPLSLSIKSQRGKEYKTAVSMRIDAKQQIEMEFTPEPTAEPQE